jgi:hypothetical protein
MTSSTALFRFRLAMAFFIGGLVLSGLTAFPLLLELKFLTHLMGLDGAFSPDGQSGPAFWILTVRFGLEEMYQKYPWLAYGTDWLAFSHIVIAMFFVGPFIRPTDSRTVLRTGVLACVLVIPLALVCGQIRGVPFYWRLIDCSFGVFGIVPLLYCLRLLKYIKTESPR